MADELKDSVIFEGLKLALVESFFKQQHYYSPSGGTTYFGGQAVELVKKINESKDFKDLIEQIAKMILDKKEDWNKLAIDTITPLIQQKARDMTQSWDLKDSMHSLINKVALEQARALFENDPVLAEKVKKAVSSKDYTVRFDVRVEIVEKREPQQ